MFGALACPVVVRGHCGYDDDDDHEDDDAVYGDDNGGENVAQLWRNKSLFCL